jgi:pilus assembly protein Flp/PilA
MGKAMTKIMNATKGFIADEQGAALVEYTVLMGIMLVTVISSIIKIGTWVNTKWTALNTGLNP